MKRLAGIFLYFALLVGGTSATLELFFRWSWHPTTVGRVLWPRLWHLWSTGRIGMFVPPFDVIADTGYDDDSRLQQIFTRTRFPPNSDWDSYDFLRAEDMREKTKYHIHINNLGFRSVHDRSAQKPKNTFRIIALGTYQTFGHGVDNGQTYEAQLQRLLNRHPRGRSFEVWNGGRHAGTAIIGLARLKYEIFDYSPDLILLDYGMVDRLLVGDDHFVRFLQLPDHWFSSLIRGPLRIFEEFFGPSRLAMMAAMSVERRHLDTNTQNFISTMEKMLNLIVAHHIPVIIIRTDMTGMPEGILSHFEDPAKQIYFFSVHSAFTRFPPDPDQIKKFWNPDNWTREYKREDNFIKGDAFKPFEYHLNPLQYNSFGQHAIARGLHRLIVSRGLIDN